MEREIQSLLLEENEDVDLMVVLEDPTLLDIDYESCCNILRLIWSSDPSMDRHDSNH